MVSLYVENNFFVLIIIALLNFIYINQMTYQLKFLFSVTLIGLLNFACKKENIHPGKQAYSSVINTSARGEIAGSRSPIRGRQRDKNTGGDKSRSPERDKGTNQKSIVVNKNSRSSINDRRTVIKEKQEKILTEKQSKLSTKAIYQNSRTELNQAIADKDRAITKINGQIESLQKAIDNSRDFMRKYELQKELNGKKSDREAERREKLRLTADEAEIGSLVERITSEVKELETEVAALAQEDSVLQIHLGTATED